MQAGGFRGGEGDDAAGDAVVIYPHIAYQPRSVQVPHVGNIDTVFVAGDVGVFREVLDVVDVAHPQLAYFYDIVCARRGRRILGMVVVDDEV